MAKPLRIQFENAYYGGMNQREGLMGMDYSAVSVDRKRFRALQEKGKSLLRQVEKIKTQLNQE